MTVVLRFVTMLLTATIRVLGAGGAKGLAAENALLGHQLLSLRRARRRTPRLFFVDRLILGLGRLLVSPKWISKLAVIVRRSTLLEQQDVAGVDEARKAKSTGFDRALVRRKYRACLQQVRDRGRMFSDAILGMGGPKRLSTDHDPLFRSHRWTANLSVLEIDELKTEPCAQISHPFVERLIGTIRREPLDQTWLWNAVDLERKLTSFRDDSNGHRVHASLGGNTPAEVAGGPPPAQAEFANFG